MQTLMVKATIKKESITLHDRHLLCIALIKYVMSIPTQEVVSVQSIPQQGQGQESPAIEAQFGILTNTQQKEMVTQSA